MKKYEAYKDSGIEWIGVIPEGWDCLRMKYFAELVTIPSTSDNKIGLENIESSTGRFIPTDSEFEGNGISFMPDDIIYGKLRPYLQKVWKADMEGNAVGDFFVLRCNSKSYPTYLKYLLLSPNFTSVANGSTYGAKMPRVSSEFMMNFAWFLPSYSEQIAIADYLDEKIGQIYKSVADIDKQIEDLKAYRQSIISEAVTKCLNPDVPMKDSGIEWIERIPSHWCEKKLKYFTSCNDEVLPENTPKGQIIRYVEISDVDNVSGIKRVTDYSFQEAPSRARRITRKDDVIISTVRTYLKAITHITQDGLIVSTGFAVIRPKRVNPSFLSYLLLNEGFLGEVVSKSVGVSYPAINVSDLLNIKLPLPSEKEQQTIASYLDEKTSKIDSFIKSLEAQREDLNALRQTLISEAVTGKIDVRDYKTGN